MQFAIHWKLRHTFWAVVALVVVAWVVGTSFLEPPKPRTLNDTPTPATPASATGPTGTAPDADPDLMWQGYPEESQWTKVTVDPASIEVATAGGHGAGIRFAAQSGDAAPTVYQLVGVTFAESDDRAPAVAAVEKFLADHPQVMILAEPSRTADGESAVPFAYLAAPNTARKAAVDPPYFIANETLLAAGLARFDTSLTYRARFYLAMMVKSGDAESAKLGLFAE